MVDPKALDREMEECARRFGEAMRKRMQATYLAAGLDPNDILSGPIFVGREAKWGCVGDNPSEKYRAAERAMLEKWGRGDGS